MAEFAQAFAVYASLAASASASNSGTLSAAPLTAAPMAAAPEEDWSWGCVLSIAGLAGATVAAVLAALASGGLAFALAMYGISGLSVADSCYK